MFRFLSNIPIFRRLVFVFAITTLIPIVVIVLLGNFYLQSIGLRGQAVQTSFAAQNIATQQQINLERMNALLQARFAQVFAQNSSALAGDPSLTASGQLTSTDVAALETEFGQTINSYQQDYEIATSPNMSGIRNILVSDTPDHGNQIISEQQTALNSVANTDWSTYQALQDQVLNELDQSTDYFTAYTVLYQANLVFLNLKNHWQQVVDAATAMGTAVTQIGPSLTIPLILYTGIAVLLTVLVIALSGLLVNSTIVNPLNRLVDLTKRIARGETRMRADVEGNDEIHQVAESMNGMLDVIVRLMQEAQYRHSDLQSHIEKLINEVSGAGEGDLRIHAEVESNELGLLASFFNHMTQDLSDLVVNVKTLARGVQNATLQLFGYMEELVDRADMQSQQIVRATSEAGNMATSSRRVAERAQSLYSVAYEARQIALGGRKAVQQTVDGMERLNENVRATSVKVSSLGVRSREINDIVEAMSSIAQQTNRLALDAAIQAAMAGENGKGFGAVAGDIRRLAELEKEQATQVGQIVRNVLEEINTVTTSIRETEQEAATGTHLVQRVGTALESIFSVVERQGSEIELTNEVVRQHLQSSTTVGQIMEDVSQSAQQNIETTREVTRQMERLAQLAGQLLSSVEVFKLREDRKQAAVVPGGPASQQLLGQRSGQVRLLQGERDNPYSGPMGRQPQSGPMGRQPQSGPMGWQDQSGPLGRQQ
jgi:methyl-accepting chemotaxis protein